MNLDSKSEEKEKGLSASNINIIVGVFFVFLLIWGPIEPYGLLIRFIYLALLPFLLWKGLNFFGKDWEIDKDYNDRITRVIWGIIAGILFVGAFASATSLFHSQCDSYARSSEGGYECVGDYHAEKGPDNEAAMFEAVGGIIFAWMAVKKDNSVGD